MQKTSLVMLLLLLFGCNSIKTDRSNRPDNFSASNFLTKEMTDSLFVDIVTYIGRKPANATAQNRFDPVFRSHYLSLSEGFEWLMFYMDADSLCHYYFIRPARSTQGSLRAAAGSFSIKKGKIHQFREWFNTPVYNRDELILIGSNVFPDMIASDLPCIPENESWVEWPDERLYYDTISFEWRYKLPAD